MTGLVDHDLAIRFLRAWTAFEAALNEVQAAGVHMDDVRAAASAAMKAAGVEAPVGPPRAQDWAAALAEYDRAVTRAAMEADAKAECGNRADKATLGDALPAEMRRVRDVVLPAYLEIGVAGSFAAACMRRDLDAATQALAEGDVVAMLKAHEALKGWEL